MEDKNISNKENNKNKSNNQTKYQRSHGNIIIYYETYIFKEKLKSE